MLMMMLMVPTFQFALFRLDHLFAQVSGPRLDHFFGSFGDHFWGRDGVKQFIIF